MRKSIFITSVVALALASSACSTRPRNFAASVSTPVADIAVFENDYRLCQQMVAAGHKANFKDAAATAVLTGVGTVGAGALVTGVGLGGVNIATGALSAGLAAVPVLGVLAGVGVSRMIRGGMEKKFKRVMTACLSEFGYEVSDWEKLKRKEDAAAYAVTRLTIAPVETIEQSDTASLADVSVTDEPAVEATPIEAMN